MVQKATAIIFSHLSDQLFDLALNQVFDYASSTGESHVSILSLPRPPPRSS